MLPLIYIAIALIAFFVLLFMTAYDSSETAIEYQGADMAVLSLLAAVFWPITGVFIVSRLFFKFILQPFMFFALSLKKQK